MQTYPVLCFPGYRPRLGYLAHSVSLPVLDAVANEVPGVLLSGEVLVERLHMNPFRTGKLPGQHFQQFSTPDPVVVDDQMRTDDPKPDTITMLIRRTASHWRR